MKWTPSSWRLKVARQLPVYKDSLLLSQVESDLSKRSGIVTFQKIYELKKQLSRISSGTGFLLQGGDCGERFETSESIVRETCQLISKMAKLIEPATGPVLKVMRLAGQFAKPRSFAFETQGDLRLLNYQGDIINGSDFTPSERQPNPHRMLTAYKKAEATLSLLTHQGDFYSSHEALLLPYEQSMTRQERDLLYDSSAHMLWLGYRTRFPDEAHAEFLRGLYNPLGVKIGPNNTIDEIQRLLTLLNPSNEADKIVLICRYGADAIRKKLQTLIQHIKKERHRVLWICDPMHGNTHRNNRGLKVRRFDDMLSETLDFISILQQQQVRPSGIHLELTGASVWECDVDGIEPSFHNTHCDPRLNPEQSLTLANEIARALKKSSMVVQPEAETSRTLNTP